MAKKLFIGSLPFTTTSEQLEALFAQVGTVISCTVIIDRFTGKSKGFGFVEMSSDEEALKAIETFNGQDFGGRAIVVNEARPMENRGDRGGDQRKSFSGPKRW